MVKRRKHWAEKQLEYLASITSNTMMQDRIASRLEEAVSQGVLTLSDAYEMHNSIYMGKHFLKSQKQIFIFDKNAADLIGNTDGLPDVRKVLERAPYNSFVVDLGNHLGFYFTITEPIGCAPDDFRDDDECMSDGRLTSYITSSGKEMAFDWFVLKPLGSVKPVLQAKSVHDALNEEVPGYTLRTEYVENIVAYLCAENAEITKCVSPVNDKPRKMKKQKYTQATWHNVGFNLGAKFRSYMYVANHANNSNASGTSRTIRPHIRRAHWHHYWTGKRDGERKLILRWIEPTLVSGKSLSDVQTTGHVVMTK